MITAKFDAGMMRMYLRAELQMGPIKIELNDGQSMNKEEAEELLKDLEKMTDDLYLEMHYLWDYNNYRPARGDEPEEGEHA